MSYRLDADKIFYCGLPGHHPLVTAQGFNGTAVQEGLNKDAADMLAAGYNVKGKNINPFFMDNLLILGNQSF